MFEAIGEEGLLDAVGEEGEAVFYHYTNDVGQAGIEASGHINPGATTGEVFVSPAEYADAATAQTELALPNTPTGYFEIPKGNLPGLRPHHGNS